MLVLVSFFSITELTEHMHYYKLKIYILEKENKTKKEMKCR